MEESRVFRTIGRINAVLFLALIVLGLGVIASLLLADLLPTRKPTVKVQETTAAGESNKVNLALGRLSKVTGHDVSYVLLQSELKGKRGPSAGYTGGEKRNVLFFTGPEMASHWLFSTHSNLIHEFSELVVGDDSEKKNPIVAFYIAVVNKDSNKDGKLDEDDDISIALAKPDGTRYTEIASSTTSIIDRTVGEDQSLILLSQADGAVWMKKYSLNDFKKISEKKIAELGIGK